MDLKKDKEGLISQRTFHKYRTLSADTVLNLHANLKLEDAEKFQRSLNAMFFRDKFIAHENTFKDLTSSGRLDLLTKSEIKLELMELYSTYKKMHEIELHYERDLNAYIYDPLAALINYPEYTSLPTEQLYEAQKGWLKADNRPINGVWLYRGASSELAKLCSESLLKIAKIDSLIVLELE